MKKELPWFLEYFYEDILWWNTNYSIRKMFNWYWIFKNKKMFAYYKDDWLYFRTNPFNKDDDKIKCNIQETEKLYFYLILR